MPTSKVSLYSDDGRWLTRVKLPRQAFLPEVIMWGARVFVRRTAGRFYECKQVHVCESTACATSAEESTA
jgi:hypothetical protein